MKSLINTIVLILITLTPLALKSQNFYLSVNSGYGFAINQQNGWLQNSESITVLNISGTNSYNTTYETVPLSLGKGFNFGGSVGYTFNDYLAVDVAASYLIGGKTKEETTSQMTEILTTGTIIHENRSSRTMYSNMFRVIPSLVINPHFEKFNPYFKIGVALGFGRIYMDNEYSSNSNSPAGPSPFSSSSIEEFYGGMAFGINSSFGVWYSFSEKISVYLEANYIGMSYAPTHSKVVEFIQNEVNNLDQLPTYSKETEYVNTYSDDNSPTNYDEPRKSLRFSFPYSSMSFNFGVIINLKKS